MQISRAQNRVQSWVLFVRNLSRERLQSVVHSVCGHKAITARKLLTPLDYVMPFKKLHRFQITCWAYLGCSWEPQKKILTFMRATPEPLYLMQALYCLWGWWKKNRRGCYFHSLVSTAKNVLLNMPFSVVMISMYILNRKFHMLLTW